MSGWIQDAGRWIMLWTEKIWSLWSGRKRHWNHFRWCDFLAGSVWVEKIHSYTMRIDTIEVSILDPCILSCIWICWHVRTQKLNAILKVTTALIKFYNVTIYLNLYSLQVESNIECGVECMVRKWNRFSFQQQTLDVGMCNITMAINETQQPLEGADYYITP